MPPGLLCLKGKDLNDEIAAVRRPVIEVPLSYYFSEEFLRFEIINLRGVMKIARFEFNLFGVNTYVVWDEATKQAAVIDPGMQTDAEALQLDEFIIGTFTQCDTPYKHTSAY